MTAGQAVTWVLLLAAFYLISKATESWVYRPSCPLCGGKTRHKSGCEWGDK